MTELDKGYESRSSRGVGSFLFSAIPAVIGLAFLIWLSFFSGCFDFKHHVAEVSEEDQLKQRMNDRVGVMAPLKSPLKLTIKRGGCFLVDRAFLDEKSITVYLKNACNVRPNYWEWHWEERSPDGTIIEYNYHNGLNGIEPGDVMEEHDDLPEDSRAVSVTVWASSKVY